MIQVWDRLVRIVHWSVALAVLANFLNESGSTWHRYGGYFAVALVLGRIAWGFLSSGYAGFASWWPGFSRVIAYVRAMFSGTAPRYLGINPAGACMAILIWLLLIALGISGWMMGLDAFWGEEWLEDTHEIIAYVLLGCVAVHVGSVIAVSVRHRENLPKAMLTGKKRST